MYKYFDISEFDCTHTGKNEMSPAFIHCLDALRERCGFPFRVTSGYRDKTHPAESRKDHPGEHNRGIAADIAVVGGRQRRAVVEEALKMGFGGVGVANTFVHVDTRDSEPTMWVY